MVGANSEAQPPRRQRILKFELDAKGQWRVNLSSNQRRDGALGRLGQAMEG